MSHPYSDFSIGAVIQGDGQVTNLDFHAEGGYMVMAAPTASTIFMIDSRSGELKKKIFAKTHGVGQVRYTHHDHSILCTSERKSHDIRYLSLHDNRYLRYFRGHTDVVTSLSMSPVDDIFLSASTDHTICLWSLDSPDAVARLSLPPGSERPRVAYDRSGVVFGVMAKNTTTGRHSVKLFDSRNYEKGPFVDIAPSQATLEQALSDAAPNMESSHKQRILASSWNDHTFSPDGTKVLVNTLSDVLFCLDAFQPHVPPVVLCGRNNTTNTDLGVCFSPDSKHILAGTYDKQVLVYNTSDGLQKGRLQGDHVAPVTSIACNPKYDVLATACLTTALWIRNS